MSATDTAGIEHRFDTSRFLLGSLPFVAALILLLGIFLATVHRGQFHGMDDAYITFRFARNLVDGHGPVFNSGERIEGYSSALHMLLISPALLFLSDESVYYYALAINALASVVALLVFHRCVRDCLAASAAIPAVFLFALTPSVWHYVWSGLESPLILLFQLLIWASVIRIREEPKPRHVTLLCTATVLSVLGRADGFVVPGLAVAYLLLIGRKRAAAYCALAAAMTLGAHVAFRCIYYGNPLPNTYYAKVGGSLAARFRVASRVLWRLAASKQFLVHLLILLATLVGQAVKIVKQHGTVRDTMSFEPFLAAGLLVYWFYIAGDALGERFLMILFPLGVFCLLRLLWKPRVKWGARVSAIVLLAALQLSPAIDWISSVSAKRHEEVDAWAHLGHHLGDYEKGKVLACDAIGKIGYYSRLHIIDMLGLCDEHIAHRKMKMVFPGHSKFDPVYVLERKPDLIAARIFYNMDLHWGLSRALYESAGYSVKYLNGAADPPVIDVRGFSDEQLRKRMLAGYDWAVLERDVGENSEQPHNLAR